MTDKHVVPEMFRQTAASRYRGRDHPSPIDQMRSFIRMYCTRKIGYFAMVDTMFQIQEEHHPPGLFFEDWRHIIDEFLDTDMTEEDLRIVLRRFLEMSGFQ